MARRFIICDGAETARLWSRIGVSDDESCMWVPREDESRARPPGFRALPGGLTTEAMEKLELGPQDTIALAGDEVDTAVSASSLLIG